MYDSEQVCTSISFIFRNSRYNYDQDFTSGEDSEMADFIDNDFEYVDEEGLVSDDSNYEPKVGALTPEQLPAHLCPSSRFSRLLRVLLKSC